MRLAVFTVSPQMSYWNFFTPTMPATTGPVWMPMRISKKGRPAAIFRALPSAMKSRISKAALITSGACVVLGVGNPPAAMYASPMVLIFSMPCFSVMWSKALKHSLRSRTSSCGLIFAHGGEALEVGEEHGDLVDVHGLGLALRLQFFRDFFRQDVQQQFLAACLLLADAVALVRCASNPPRRNR
jgi:hypothetical protein